MWSTFERELKKVIDKDSELYHKISTTSLILVENLNETKVSNVVKENNILVKDHESAVQRIENMI